MSRLPNANEAIVDENKITGYLLSATHPTGRLKAQFFNSFGFQLAAWGRLRDAILRHGRENEVTDTIVTEFGTKYQVEGPLVAPDGRTPRICSVWFIEAGGVRPRFVTAYPV